MAEDSEPDSEEIWQEKWHALNEELDRQFPDANFDFGDTITDITELDEKFADEQVIIIYDKRADKEIYPYWDLSEEEVATYKNYTLVRSSNGRFITLRDIYNAMIADPRYSDPLMRKGQRILREFMKSPSSDIQYTASFTHC